MSFTDVIKDSVLNGFNTDISTIQICVILGITVLLGSYIFLVGGIWCLKYKTKLKGSTVFTELPFYCSLEHNPKKVCLILF